MELETTESVQNCMQSKRARGIISFYTYWREQPEASERRARQIVWQLDDLYHRVAVHEKHVLRLEHGTNGIFLQRSQQLAYKRNFVVICHLV
jgi:hypothetical protein